MSQPVAVKLETTSNAILVSGELTFATVKGVLDEVQTLAQSLPVLDIDLVNVTRSDSAGLALLIHWMRLAKLAKKQIIFHHIPEQMLAIASASGLDELLPLS